MERAADLAEVAKRGVITPDQATRLAQTLLKLVPGYGSGESVLQLMDDARRQLDELAVRTGMYGASARSENDVRRSRAAPRRADGGAEWLSAASGNGANREARAGRAVRASRTADVRRIEGQAFRTDERKVEAGQKKP